MLVAEDLRERLHLILLRHLSKVPAGASIPLEVDLGRLGLDSAGAIDMLLDIEETFSFRFPPVALSPETFATALALEITIGSLVSTSTRETEISR
jgi:acyl carrier protein